jgi:predicted neutral ceramidase superfamily lipid hydrolase
MATKGGYEKFLNDLNPFSIGIPRTTVLFFLLLLMSVIIGIAAVSLMNYKLIGTDFSYIAVNGSITGMLAIMLPTLLTILIVKSIKRYIDTKYIFFISIIGTISYSVFILLASIIYILTHDYATATAIILAGDASIFGWWFFADKVVLGQKKRAIFLALVQPTLNILLYLPSSRFILTFTTSFNILLLKLYAGIFIFLIVSYAIIYLVDRPYNKNFGFHSFDAVSQLLQNWLFDINISAPFGQNFGTPTDIRTDTILFRNSKGSMKSIFFAPDIHYGPSGTLAGSDFPYMLEHYSNAKYKVPTFVMHCTVDMDHNPVSSSQFNNIRNAFEEGIRNSRSAKGRGFSYSESAYKDSKVIRLGLDALSLVTLTRAPKVTEDVSLESAVLFNELLEAKFGTSVLIDAHNSRYETAPKAELEGVTFNSRPSREYVKAINEMNNESHKSRKIKMGVASKEIYSMLGDPIDIAKGNLNIAVFQFNGFKYAMIQFNANNALPRMRDAILKHIKKKYGIKAELYTTDTHAVNSLEFNANNVLGRHTRYAKLVGIIDETMDEAISNIEQVTVHHNRNEMKKFKVWGPDTMKNMITIAKSTYGLTRLLVPIIVVLGFIVAAWIILII